MTDYDKLNDNKFNVESIDTAESKMNNKSENPLDEFASGLPSWDLVPPQMVIKRVKRVL